MDEIWDQARIEQYIADGIEESLNLDYKAADALSDGKNNEITKDVSAMANSAGGLLIYGISEYKDSARKHLPEKIDPIDRKKFSKEKLEHVISNIQPKIDGLRIYPIPIDTAPTHVVYVVEIPQSYTAHQSGYKKYYKRYNFESVAMDDYEIRDVMGRGQYPRIEPEFEIEITQEERRVFEYVPPTDSFLESFELDSFRNTHELEETYKSFLSFRQQDKPERTEIINHFDLKIWLRNTGRIYANYVNIFMYLPDIVLPQYSDKEPWNKRQAKIIDGTSYFQHFDDNTVRDVVDFKNAGLSSIPTYGPSRFVPILPRRAHGLESVRLRQDFVDHDFSELIIMWEISSDNAPPLKGEIAIKDIEIIDKRNESEDE